MLRVWVPITWAKRFDRNVFFLEPYFESGGGLLASGLGWRGGLLASGPGWWGVGFGGWCWAGTGAGGWAGAGLGLAALKRKLVYSKMERLCPDQTKETNSNKQFLFISFLRV